MVLVTGGARVGKSRFAQSICSREGAKVFFIATAVAADELMMERIRRSRQQRPYHWETYEGYLDLAQKLDEVTGKYDVVLIESMTSLVMELLSDKEFIKPGTSFRDTERKIMEEINAITMSAKRASVDVVFVTNETVAYPGYMSWDAQIHMEILGRVNQYIASVCSEVYLVVSGIPYKLK